MIKNLANIIANNTTNNKNNNNTNDRKNNSKSNNNEIGDDEFNDLIDKDKGDGNDESKKSFGNYSNNVGSLEFDSSVTNFNEKNFDYVEDLNNA